MLQATSLRRGSLEPWVTKNAGDKTFWRPWGTDSDCKHCGSETLKKKLGSYASRAWEAFEPFLAGEEAFVPGIITKNTLPVSGHAVCLCADWLRAPAHLRQAHLRVLSLGSRPSTQIQGVLRQTVDGASRSGATSRKPKARWGGQPGFCVLVPPERSAIPGGGGGLAVLRWGGVPLPGRMAERPGWGRGRRDHAGWGDGPSSRGWAATAASGLCSSH